MDFHGFEDFGLVLDESLEFWRFVLEPVYRRTVLREWRAASLGEQALGLLDALWHAFAGLAPVVMALAVQAVVVGAIVVWACS